MLVLAAIMILVTAIYLLCNVSYMRTCDKKDCKKPVTHTVHLSLAVHGNHPPAVSTPILHVCEEHSNITWDELVTTEMWQRIKQEFSAIGRMPPRKEYSKVVTQKYDPNVIREWHPRNN